MSTLTAPQLLTAARELLDRPADGHRGLWNRAAAVLGRQALEARIVELDPRLADASGHHQVLALREVLDDESQARQIAFTWSALSAALHHSTVDTTPTTAELHHLLDAVESFTAVASRARNGGGWR